MPADMGLSLNGLICGPHPLAGASTDGEYLTGLCRAQAHETAVQDVKRSVIMIVDNEPAKFERVLRGEGYQEFCATNNPARAEDMLRFERPDIVVLDVTLPEMGGMTFLSAVHQDASVCHIPILALTSHDDKATRLQALRLGASDFLNKPVEPDELVLRIRNMLIVKAHRDQLAKHSVRLEYEVRQRTAELDESRREVIQILARAAEFRDEETGNHVLRVGRYTGILARQLGYSDSEAELIEQAAILHDVGKIGVSDTILLKPGKLTEAEMQLMRQHCQKGMQILLGCSTKSGSVGSNLPHIQSPVLRLAACIAMSHHEKWDGSGYPLGLKGDAIPLESRIAAVADVFDALSNKRPYKPAFPLPKCLEILEQGRGTHFDPRVLDAFQARLDDIARVCNELADR